MANFTDGMNIPEVMDLSKLLEGKAAELDKIVQMLNGKIASTTWNGKDANDFKGPWWDGHRTSLKKTAEDLRGFARSAKNNADEQAQVSGR